MPRIRRRQDLPIRIRVVVTGRGSELGSARRLLDPNASRRSLDARCGRRPVEADLERGRHERLDVTRRVDRRLERLDRLDPDSRRDPEQSRKIRLNDAGRARCVQARELRFVPLTLDGQDIVARGHADVDTRLRVAEMRFVGAHRVDEDPFTFASGDQRPVGDRGFEHDVLVRRGTLERCGAPAPFRRLDSPREASARPERNRQRETGSELIG